MAGLATGLFAVVLASYLFFPAGARGVINLIRTDRVEWRDTTQLVEQEAASRKLLTTIDSSLAALRARSATMLSVNLALALPASEAARRDSLLQLATSLAALLQRAESAPLTESFRALAAHPALTNDPAVRALSDSLTEVVRERDDLGAGAAVDPVFVALTTRANELGRGITAIGESQLALLSRAVLAIEAQGESSEASRSRPPPDSSVTLTARRNAMVVFRAAERALADARLANAVADSTAARERSRNQLAPLPLLALGAVVLSIALTFALLLLDEMRSPRVADAAEAERLTEVRVLGVARLRTIPPERTRRAADRAMPALLDPTFDAYRVLAWHLASQWPRDGVVTVTGDQPLVAATVGANLAAVLANDARVTLLVDTDLATEPVRAILGLPRSPGLAAVVENRRKWSESLVSVTVGRGRSMDVLPGGGRDTPLGPAESQVLVDEVKRAARRHDATVVVTTLAGAKRFRAGDDVVVCATLTSTRLATLARSVASLVDDGARVRGVMLWEGAPPAPMRGARDGIAAA